MTANCAQNFTAPRELSTPPEAVIVSRVRNLDEQILRKIAIARKGRQGRLPRRRSGAFQLRSSPLRSKPNTGGSKLGFRRKRQPPLPQTAAASRLPHRGFPELIASGVTRGIGPTLDNDSPGFVRDPLNVTHSVSPLLWVDSRRVSSCGRESSTIGRSPLEVTGNGGVLPET